MQWKISIYIILFLVSYVSMQDSSNHVKNHKIIHREVGNSTIKCVIKLTSHKLLYLIVSYEDINYVRFNITDNFESRFVLPEEEPFPFSNRSKKNTYDYIDDVKYRVRIQDEPFQLNITNRITGEVILSLDTVKNPFIFEDHYLDFTFILPSSYIYGLGERTFDFKLKSGKYTLYNRDQYGVVEDGSGGKNLYGSHPMYLNRDLNGSYHVNFFRNSLPMDAIISDLHNNSISLNYKVAGGIIDFHFFVGDSYPETALKAYHSYLGGFELPPFWSMGWQQSRWGYTSYDQVLDVVQNYDKHLIPLDVIWLDIDYMIDKVQFTLDESRYNRNDFNNMLKKHQKKFVLIMEPSMALKSDPHGYVQEGITKDLFIKDSNGNNMVTVVWPGQCYFIDYFNPKADKYWTKMLENFNKVLDFSGVWLDMNEIATFPPWLNCNDETNYPYLPGGVTFNVNTICPNAKHHNNIDHVNIHNYYPNQQARLTNNYLRQKFPKEYPFILSRANGPGLGKYSTHWTGDNYANYEFLRYSIATIFNSGLFGIPMTGADICGFGGMNPSENLCARWMQLGTLYPFARSHSHESYINKEPWRFGEIMLKTSQVAVKFRYKLLKFYYSLFIRSRKVGLLFKPLFFEFPDDKQLLDKQEVYNNQFMIGSEILVVPNLNESPVFQAYFPKGTWYDLRNDEKQLAGMASVTSNFMEIAPVYIREGKTIFMQNIDRVLNVFHLDNNFELFVALANIKDNILVSEGFLPALNDYNNKDTVENCIYNDCNYMISSEYDTKLLQLKIRFIKPKYVEKDFKPLNIVKIRVYGIDTSKSIKSDNQFLLAKLVGKKVNYHTIDIEFEGLIQLSADKDHELTILFE